MNEVEIDIVGPKVLQRRIQSAFNVVRVVRVVPELGRKEDLLTRNARFLDGIANSWFGPVAVVERRQKLKCTAQGYGDL